MGDIVVVWLILCHISEEAGIYFWVTRPLTSTSHRFSIMELLALRYLFQKLCAWDWCHLRSYRPVRVLREKNPQDFKIRKDCLDWVWLQTFVARQLLDNFSKLGYLLPGASKSWLPWNLQNVIGEREFSFEPEKTAWKRRLQLFELVLVLLLNVECFSKLGFGPFCHQGAKLTYW